MIQNKKVLVSGAGRGIGRSIALSFAKEGFDVSLVARTKSEIDAVADEISSLGVNSIPVVCDVTSSEKVKKVFREIEEKMGSIDIFVANAGLLLKNELVNTDDQLWGKIIDANLNSVFYTTRTVIKGMIERKWGRIIVISSVSGKLGGAHRSAYHTAKHGAIGFVRSIALEVAEYEITVNAICPGFVETKMMNDNQKLFSENVSDTEDIVDYLKKNIPMKRFLDPQEIASMSVYLASDSASGITGQAYTISCGAVQI
ncbi:MAG: SDR family NAD(P)-dependent oxidoreductase [Nitrospinota bacterium]|nr:SDR family NAD(P)-dependent oxidoreductase [Nitrospinota bacterium]